MLPAPRLRSLREAIEFFSQPHHCFEFALALRWPEGVVCPTCGGREMVFLSTRRVWKCKRTHRKRQFSVKVGTIFEDSPIGLEKWFAVIWMLANRPDALAPNDLARKLGVTAKTARSMMHRVQLAMRTGSFEANADELELARRAAVIPLPPANAVGKGLQSR